MDKGGGLLELNDNMILEESMKKVGCVVLLGCVWGLPQQFMVVLKTYNACLLSILECSSMDLG